MQKRVLGIGAAALLLAVSTLPVLAQEAVAPDYKWTKGETARYKMTIEKAQKVTGAQQREASHTRSYVWSQQVTDVGPDGTAMVEAKFESAGVHLQIPANQLDFSYDPANPEDEKRKASALAMPYSGIVGETLAYKVSKKGKLLGVVGFDKLTQKVVDGVKAAPQGAISVPFALDSLGDLLSAQIEGLFRILPEKPVKFGTLYKKTKVREADPGLGSLILQTDYTLVGSEALNGDDSFKFTYITGKTLETPAAAAAGAAAPAATPAGPKLIEATGTGEFYLSKSKGIVTKCSFQSGMSVEIPLPADPNAVPGTAPATVTQRDDLKVALELAPAQTSAAPAAGTTAPAEGGSK